MALFRYGLQIAVTSPIAYILVTLALNSAMLSVIFFIAWKTQGKKPYALNWSLAFLAATCQWTLNLLGGSFPSFEAYWLTVNAFGLVVITLGLRGHCQRTNCQNLPKNLWPYTIAVYAVIIWFTAVEQHVGMRTALLPVTAAATLFLSARMIIKHRKKSRPAECAAAIMMILFGASQVLVAYIGLQQGAAGNDYYRDLYVNINFLSLPAGYTGMAMFVIFMLASDLSEQMKEIAVRDQLTGLFNRRGFAEQTERAYATARRTDRPVSVIMTDIDHFKTINDEFGHAAGDNALDHFAKILKVTRRTDDILARMGGEEFAIVLPGTELEESIRIAEELCRLLKEAPMIVDGQTVTMTASFGVATLSLNDTCLADAVIRADRALYRSKRAGRNRVDLESSQMMRGTDGNLKPVSG
jgi:diguanylate cyclase (GGDEF)-like protein